MAERKVVREDVVRIGFEVDGGLDELQAQIDALLGGIGGQTDDLIGDMDELSRATRDATSGLNDVSNGTRGVVPDELRDAANAAGDLARNGRNAAGDVGNAGDEARRAAKPFSQMVKEAAALARTKFQTLTNAIRKIKDSAIDRVMSGVTRLKAGFAGLQNVRLRDITRGLDSGLGAAVTGAKKLLAAIRNIADVGLGKLKAGMAGIGKSALDASGKLVKGLGGIGLKAIKGLTTGILATGAAMGGLMGAAVKVGMSFEAGMSQVAATMGITKEANPEEFNKLNKAAKEAGATTQFSATQASEALNFLALAGYDADKAVAALPSVLNLAAAGGMELAAASDMVTDSMAALGIEATQDNLTEFSDKLAKTAQKSNTSVQQLGDAILTVGGTGKMLSGGTTEMNTLLGIIADNGVKGAEGGTKLRNMILSLTAPTDVAAKKLKELGISVFNSKGEMRPMNEIMQDMNQSMSTMTEESRAIALNDIFNKADLKSVNAVLANSGDRFNELSGLINESDDACKNMAATMNDNLRGAIVTFSSAAEGLGIAVYENVNSPLKSIVQEATGWVGELTKATETGGVDGLVRAVGDIMAKVIVKIASSAPKLVNAGISVIRALLSGVKKNSTQVAAGAADTLSAFVGGITSLLPDLILLGLDLILQFAKSITSQLPQMMSAGTASITSLLDGVLQRMPEIVQTATALIQTLVGGISQNLPAIINAGIALVTSLLSGLTQMLPNLIQSGVQLVLSLVMGLLQSLPALLQSAGEMVVALARGIGQAIPQLIAAVPQLVGALIDAIMSTDWIKLGCDIINSLGAGLLEGVASIFLGGKESGAAAGEGAATGLKGMGQFIGRAAQDTADLLTADLQPDTNAIAASGAMVGNGLTAGLEGTTQSVGIAGQKISSTLTSSLQPNTNAIAANGASVMTSFGRGMIENVPLDAAVSSGAMVGNGLTAGLEGTTQSMGTMALDALNANLQPDVDAITEYAVNITDALTQGLDRGGVELTRVAFTLGTSTMASLREGFVSGAPLTEAVSCGQAVMSALQKSLQSNSLFAVARANGAGVAKALSDGILFGTNIASSVSTIMESLRESLAHIPRQTAFSSGRDMVTVFCEGALLGIPKKVLTDGGAKLMNKLADGVSTGSGIVMGVAKETCDQLTAIVSAINLISSGKNVMVGFVKGIQSMRSRVVMAAKNIAQSVQSTINEALDIHSSSRVMEDSGMNTGRGLVRGMGGTLDKIKSMAGSLANAVITPFRTPAVEQPIRLPFSETPPFRMIGIRTAENSGLVGANPAHPTQSIPPTYQGYGQTVENNTYAPVFNLTITGGDSDRDNERKVKNWVKAAWAELQEGMSRRNPSLQEV